MNGAVRGHEFIGSHARIADDDEPRFRVEANQFIDWKWLGTPWRVLPEIVVDRVVKEKGLEIFELGPSIIEEGLDDPI